MNLVGLIDFFRDRLRIIVRISYVVLAFLVLTDWFFIDKSKVHVRLEELPGFWSVFGFVACVLIIFVSKWFGHLGIMTREDYYDK